MNQIEKFPQAVVRHLKYYVYLYINPETDKVFYVGKGRGNRAFNHAHGDNNTGHGKVITKLKERGLKPRIEILVHGLNSESEAFAVEMAAIDLLGLEQLTNIVHGHHSAQRGRMSPEQILAIYQQKPVTIEEPAVLIRIARAFRYGMTDVELYDLTRSAWKVGVKRNNAEYVFSVHAGIVREVYHITKWLKAGTTFRHDYPKGVCDFDGRWEFVGTVAEDAIRRKYRNHSVANYFSEHSQNPILYVNC